LFRIASGILFGHLSVNPVVRAASAASLHVNVNDWTIDLGEKGSSAFTKLHELAVTRLNDERSLYPLEIFDGSGGNI